MPSFLPTVSSPEIHNRAAFAFFRASFRCVYLERALLLLARLLPVAVVRLVVEDQDFLDAHELRHDPCEHLSLSFEGRERFASSLKQWNGCLWAASSVRAA